MVYIKKIKEVFIWFLQLIASFSLFIGCSVCLIFRHSAEYIYAFLVYVCTYICSRNFLDFLKRVNWPLFSFMPRRFYRRNQTAVRWRQKRVTDQSQITPLSRFLRESALIFFYFLFRSGYLNSLGRRFGYTDIRFSDISSKKRNIVLKLGKDYRSFYDLRRLARTRSMKEFNKDRAGSFFGFPPVFRLFLDTQLFDDFLKSKFTVVDGFVIDFFSSDISPKLQDYLKIFNYTGSIQSAPSEDLLLSLDNDPVLGKLGDIRADHVISLRVLRNLLIYEHFRFYSKGGLRAFRQYQRYMRAIDADDKENFLNSYVEDKWPRFGITYLNIKKIKKYLAGWFSELQGSNTGFGSGSRFRFPFFVWFRFFLRRLRIWRSLRYTYRHDKKQKFSTPGYQAYEAVYSFSSTPSMTSFFLSLFLYMFIFLSDSMVYCRDRSYMVVLKFNLFLLPSVCFNICLLFLFFIFYFFKNFFKKIIFFISAFVNFLLDLKFGGDLPAPVYHYVHNGTPGLKRCVLSYAPSNQSLDLYNWDFRCFYFLTRARLFALINFVSALFRFFAYFFFYPVRSGPIGFFRKQLKNPDRRNTFYFLVFVFLAVFVLYIVYREYTLLVEFLALLKAGDYKRMNDWFMIKLTIIEKYIWFQFLGNRQQRTRYRMRVRITFKRYLLDLFRFMKARAARKKILKKFFGRRYFVKSLRKYFRKKYYFKKSFKKRLLKMRQTAIWVPKRITEWHFDRLVTYRGRIKRHCKRVYRWHYVTDFAGFILFVTRILFKYLEFSAFLFWNLLSLLHVYLVIAVACFVKYLILFSLISFKVITVPYVLYTLLTYSGAWFSRQVIMNPQIRDILRRYRRALKWFIFINLFTLFALNIWRYNILGPVGFFEELAEILYLAFDGLEFFFICCLFVVGIHFLLIYFALPSGFLYYTDLLVRVCSDQDLLLFLAVILLIFLYIFSKVILPCLMFTRKLIKYSLFTDIPYSRERAFLDEFEIHERMVRRCSVASRNGKRLPLRGCIELFVLLCVGFSLIFLRTFVFFSSIMHLVRRFIRGLIRAKYAREFKFSLTVLDRNVTIVVTIPKFVFLIRRRFSRKLRRNLCYFNAVVYEFALKFFLKLRVLAISVFIEFYWLAVSFFATFYYLFIDVCARRTRDARLRLFKNFKIMRAFVFLNTFRLALLFYLGKLLLLMTFFFTSLLWFAYLLSIFFKKILYFFYEQMSFRIARARLYGLPYYDRPWYAIFWCVCIIVKSLILWALLLMFIFIIGIFLFLV